MSRRMMGGRGQEAVGRLRASCRVLSSSLVSRASIRRPTRTGRAPTHPHCCAPTQCGRVPHELAEQPQDFLAALALPDAGQSRCARRNDRCAAAPELFARFSMLTRVAATDDSSSA